MKEDKEGAYHVLTGIFNRHDAFDSPMLEELWPARIPPEITTILRTEPPQAPKPFIFARHEF